MELTGEFRIAAPRDRVWQALNDPEVLKRSIPGCDSFERLSPTEFKGSGTVKVGPVKATFGGAVTLADIEAPRRYTLIGEGTGVAGFAKGQAKVELTEAAGETVLNYTVSAQVGGRIAQVGARLIEGASRKLAEEFFGRFVEIVAPAPAAPMPPVAPVPAPAEPPTTKPGGVSAAVWVPAVIVVVLALLWLFSR